MLPANASKVLVLAVGLVHAFGSLGQQSYSLIIDGASVEEWGWFHPTLCPDGGVLAHSADTQTQLTKANSSGTILWRRSYDMPSMSVNGRAMCPDGNNGAFIGGNAMNVFQAGVGLNDMDTLDRTAVLARVDMNGDVLWRTDILSRQIAMDIDEFNSQASFAEIALGSAGPLYMLLAAPSGGIDWRWDLCAFDPASGSLLWSHRVSKNVVGTMPTENMEMKPMQVLSDGSVILATSELGGSLTVARVDQTGALLWMNTYDYTSSVFEEYKSMLLSSSGNIIVTGTLNVPGALYTVLHHLSTAGDLLRSELVPGTQWVTKPHGTGELPDGDLLIARRGYNERSELLRLDTIGGIVRRFVFQEPQVGPDTYFLTNVDHVDILGSVTLVAGRSGIVDSTFGVSTLNPVMMYFTTPIEDHCLVHTDSVQRLQAPAGIVTVEDAQDAYCVPLQWPFIQTAAQPLAYVDLFPYATSDQCAFVGVPGEPPQVGIRLFPNPVGSGGTVTVAVQNIQHLLVSDALGRSVNNVFLSGNGPSELDIGDLPSGVYVLTGKSIDGTVRWSQRLVVR